MAKFYNERQLIGLLIKRARERRGITIEEMAPLVNGTPAYLVKIEEGMATTVRYKTIRAIFAQLDINPELMKWY